MTRHPARWKVLSTALLTATLATAGRAAGPAPDAPPPERPEAGGPPPQDDRPAQPGDRPATGGDRPAPGDRPPPPGDVRRAVDDLSLTPEQRAKIDPAMRAFREKQQQARVELLKQLKEALTPEQYERVVAATTPPGPPQRPGEAADRPPREDRPANGDRGAKGDRGARGNRPAPGDPVKPAGPAATATPAATPAALIAPSAPGEQRLAVTFAGGHDTDPRDRGRPVALVAAGLGVPADVFRETFTHVRPAGAGQEPEAGQVRQNKAALMKGLSPYGVTNDRLDEVSNYYRYVGSRGELWRNRPAVAYATVRDGKLTGFTVTDAGAGYTTPPTVAVEGRPDLAATVALGFGKDLATNGSVKAITLGAAK